MAVHEQVHSLSPDQLESVSGGTDTLGVYRPGFQYKQESLDFFRHCVGEETYQLAMNSDAGREHFLQLDHDGRHDRFVLRAA